MGRGGRHEKVTNTANILVLFSCLAKHIVIFELLCKFLGPTNLCLLLFQCLGGGGLI